MSQLGEKAYEKNWERYVWRTLRLPLDYDLINKESLTMRKRTLLSGLILVATIALTAVGLIPSYASAQDNGYPPDAPRYELVATKACLLQNGDGWDVWATDMTT